jgi:predicted LPLAT superfamily acyltransferase
LIPSWHTKPRGSRVGYRIFVSVLKNFGVLPAYFLLRIVAFYYFLFSYRSAKPIFKLFHSKLGYSILKSLLKLYRNYFLFGQSLIDKVVIMSEIPNRFSFEFDGEDNLRKMVNLQKGGLLLSAHIGNWEIAGHLLKRLQTRIHIVMFDGEQAQIKEYLAGITGERNMHIIVIKNDLTHIYEIDEALKKNEFVCMHADRYMEGNKTISTRFLSEQASFPAGPFMLAYRFKVPVSFVFALKENNFHYHFFASEIKEFGMGEKEILIQEMLKDFAGEMEKKLRDYPEQWFNYYDFWRQ